MDFVDDFLLMSEESQTAINLDICIKTLESCGWTINYKKSVLQWRRTCVFVGFMLHTTDKPWITVTQPKIHKLKLGIVRRLRRGFFTARELSRIMGQCISMTRAILPAICCCEMRIAY